MIEVQRHMKGLIHDVRYPEADLHMKWSLEFGDFAEHFVEYNLDA
jgi:hypothetical protein